MARQGVRDAHARAAPGRPIPTTGAPVPRDGATLGEVMLRGNTIMKGYLENPRATAAAFARRLVPHGRPRRLAPRRLHRDQGPQQGHHHLRRREHQLARGRGVPVPPSAGDGGGGGRAARREVGRDAVRVRRRSSRAPSRSTAADIIAWCRERIAHFKVPRTVVFGAAAQDRRRARSRSSCCASGRARSTATASERGMTMFAPDALAGKVALVTGASSGLGRHFAQLLARHGADRRPRRAARRRAGRARRRARGRRRRRARGRARRAGPRERAARRARRRSRAPAASTSWSTTPASR